MKKISILLALAASIIALQCFASATTANPFRVKTPKETNLYINASGQMAYMEMDGDLLFRAINALPALPRVTTPSSDKATANFMTVKPLANYERHKYTLKPTELVYDSISYQLTNEQYDYLKSIMDVFNSTVTARGTMEPQWLVTMNPNRVKKTTCKIDGKTVKQTPGVILDLSEVPFEVKGVLVNAFSYEKYTGSMAGKFTNALEFRLDYDSGMHYNVIAAGDKLYVEASNKDFGCQYTLFEADYMIDQMRRNWIYSTSNVNSGDSDDYVSEGDTILK